MSRFRTRLVRCAGLLAVLLTFGLPTRSEDNAPAAARPTLSYTIALTARLRITLSATHKPEHIVALANALATTIPR